MEETRLAGKRTDRHPIIVPGTVSTVPVPDGHEKGQPCQDCPMDAIERELEFLEVPVVGLDRRYGTLTRTAGGLPSRGPGGRKEP